MLKALALIGLGAVFALSSEVSVAQTGYGTRPNTHPNLSFQRHWNRNNESKDHRARQGDASSLRMALSPRFLKRDARPEVYASPLRFRRQTNAWAPSSVFIMPLRFIRPFGGK